MKTAFAALLALTSLLTAHAAVPADYAGKPFGDNVCKGGAQKIPGIVQCAWYDLGGEGVAYHDVDAINHGSGELNRQPEHERPHASEYIQHFREQEGVDLSYAKDIADLNHPNLVSPLPNQLYIGWTENGEWVNFTVDVARAGKYRILALYSNEANAVTFDLNCVPAATGQLPIATGHWHKWNFAEIGSITFPEAGRELLTFHYNRGNNFAYFVFLPESR